MDSSMNRMLKNREFTASQIPFILTIGESEGISMKELCTSLGSDKGLTNRVVHTLIENGFVTDKSESGRTYSLYLTEKGREAMNEAMKVFDDMLIKVLECLDEEEKEQLGKISTKINRRLDELYRY